MTHADLTATDRERSDAASACVPTAQLFVVLCCDDLRAAAGRHSLAHIDEVSFGRAEQAAVQRVTIGTRRRLELRVADRHMSRTHAELRQTERGWELVDLGSRNGTRLGGVRLDRAAVVPDGAFFELGHTIFRLREALATPVTASGDQVASTFDGPAAFHSMVPELAIAFDRLAKMARSRVSTILTGETGTGKEWLARAIHALSDRRGAFVAVNCGALPPGLVESSLFGHVRGAFSGANRDELGYMRAADGGTLFLDEIGELPPGSQTALLRVLQESEVVPVGATRGVAVDLRVLSATHVALLEQIERGGFRNDLFARLAGFTFEAPPLRERLEDFGLILRTLAPELEAEAGGPITLTLEAVRQLLGHDWPRNLRELRQCLASAAVLAEDRCIGLAQLQGAFVSRREDGGVPEPVDDAALEQRLSTLFREHRGNVTQVARAMGKARVQIQRWMKRFGIEPDQYR